MGRPAKPIAVLEAQGTKQKCRHAKRENEVTSGESVQMPDSLTGEAAAFWSRNVPKFEAMGILDGVDTETLVMLCKAYANWHREQEAYENDDKPIRFVVSAWGMFDKLASRYGMTPVDRTKLATEKKADDDPFTEWLKRKNGGNN